MFRGRSQHVVNAAAGQALERAGKAQRGLTNGRDWLRDAIRRAGPQAASAFETLASTRPGD